MSTPRVRFAPSPTGMLHIGGLRTALFNYLLAKQAGGQFIVRIEDTDQERYQPEAEQALLDDLAWAGLEADESTRAGGAYGPYKQSERLGRYQVAVEQLIAAGHAYRCYTSAEELTQMRQAQQARGLPPKYDGRHRGLSGADEARYVAEGRKAVVRMRMPDQGERIVVEDRIRGKVAFNTEQLDDQVLLKSDGFPTYHLAVVVDDHAMQITDVLRAEEWLPSTPKHLLLYRWLGFQPPRYAHLPLILNDDRSKMSKRKGDISIRHFREQGYLPAGLINALALLGWNAGTDKAGNEKEFYTLEELIETFSVERIGKSGAVFDEQKMQWFNQQHIAALSSDKLLETVVEYASLLPKNSERLSKTVKSMKQSQAIQSNFGLGNILKVMQPQMQLLSDVEAYVPMFQREEGFCLPEAIQQVLAQPEARQVLQAMITELQAMITELQSSDRKDDNTAAALTEDAFKQATKAVQKAVSIKGKALFTPLRLALTAAESGPDLAQFAAVLGRAEILQRLEHALTGN